MGCLYSSHIKEIAPKLNCSIRLLPLWNYILSIHVGRGSFLFLEDVHIRKQPVVFRIEFGCVLYCNAEMPFMLRRKESVAGQHWLALSRRIFEPTVYLCYLGVSGHRQELTPPTMRICFSLVRQDSTFMGIFLLLSSHLPKTICLGEGMLIH